MADNHVGYSMSIGGVAAYREMVSPSGVGYDIGCGVMAVRTSLHVVDIRADLSRIADEIAARISFGVGRKNPTPVDHSLFDSATWADVPELTEQVLNRGALVAALGAKDQLGTVGAGRPLRRRAGRARRAAPCGSPATSAAAGRPRRRHRLPQPRRRSRVPRRPDHRRVDAPLPTLLPLTEAAARELGAADPSWSVDVGRRYEAGMRFAGEYAYAGRENVAGKVLALLGTGATETVHNHHNYAWDEEHGGEIVHVVRKGATPAFPGQAGFVGGSMGDWAVVVEGVDSPLAERTLRSTVHGAGRVMSRSKAKGNRKGTRPGVISREMMRDRLDEFRRETGYPLEVRGGDVDESPFVYRRLGDVVRAHEETETIRVTHRMLPVVVCMAGSDIWDPFKD